MSLSSIRRPLGWTGTHRDAFPGGLDVVYCHWRCFACECVIAPLCNTPDISTARCAASQWCSAGAVPPEFQARSATAAWTSSSCCCGVRSAVWSAWLAVCCLLCCCVELALWAVLPHIGISYININIDIFSGALGPSYYKITGCFEHKWPKHFLTRCYYSVLLGNVHP